MLEQLCSHVRGKISAHVDWGLISGSCVRRPVSKVLCLYIYIILNVSAVRVNHVGVLKVYRQELLYSQ